MAKAASGVVLALASVVALSGCGTTVNLVGLENVPPDHIPTSLSPRVQMYGGVLTDLQFLHMVTVGRNQIKGNQNEPWEDATGAALLLIDMPNSAVGDTLTLPLAAYAEWKRLAAEPPQPNVPAVSRPDG